MVTLNLVDPGVILQIVTLLVAVVMSFLALRSQFLWLVACFSWAGVIVVWDNAPLQIISIFMAIVSLVFFMAGHK